MPRKFAVITALALSTVVSTAGIASAGGYGNGGSGGSSGNTTTVKGGEGFTSGPVVVQEAQQGVVIVNGTVVDIPCAVPWHNGAVLAATLAPNSRYSACNTGKINQSNDGVYNSGLLL
ncbi:hypothetical protein [Streptomyces sp. NPDC056479]|uniref:hypothetical protein n=1 Tax=unclassified Streptomyces TaxID=2593676 RepID=UPI0036907A44